MPHHNYIEVMREEEKRLYRIMKELSLYGESEIENAKGPEWERTFKILGIRGKPLIKKGLLEPIFRTDFHSKYNKRIIRVPKGIEVIEENGNKTIKNDQINIRVSREDKEICKKLQIPYSVIWEQGIEKFIKKRMENVYTNDLNVYTSNKNSKKSIFSFSKKKK